MKRIFGFVFGFIFGLILLTSCQNTNVSRDYQTTSNQDTIELVVPVVINSWEHHMSIIKYKVDGHNYQFHSISLGNRSGVGGPVHDPQCGKCAKN